MSMLVFFLVMVAVSIAMFVVGAWLWMEMYR